MPVQKEIYAKDLSVIGKIPEDIKGAYIRIGPNTRYFVGGESHTFDGDGMLHSIKFDEGKVVAYSNHFVRTDIFKAEEKWNRPIGIKMSQMTGFKALIYGFIYFTRRLTGVVQSSKPKDRDNLMAFQSNTNVYNIAGRLLSLHETDLPYQIRLLCNGILETLGSVKLGKAFTCTAHPHTDYETRETFFFRYDQLAPYYQYGYVGAKGYCSPLVDIDIRKSIMIHDFSITKNYAIFLDLPLLFDPVVVVTGNKLPFRYDENMKARFGIFPRYGSDKSEISWFELPNQYIFHVMNSWEVEGTNQVKLIACRYNKVDLNLSLISYDVDEVQAKNINQSVLCEYTFDLDTKECGQKDLGHEIVEFPQVNQRLFGKPTKYGYTILQDKGYEQGYGFIKYDLTDTNNLKQEQVIYPQGKFGGELTFVQRQVQNGKTLDEDDGYLVGYVHDYKNDTSSFVIYDAKLRTKEPLAEVLLPQRVPYGFHGNFFSSEELQKISHRREDILDSMY